MIGIKIILFNIAVARRLYSEYLDLKNQLRSEIIINTNLWKYFQRPNQGLGEIVSSYNIGSDELNNLLKTEREFWLHWTSFLQLIQFQVNTLTSKTSI